MRLSLPIRLRLCGLCCLVLAAAMTDAVARADEVWVGLPGRRPLKYASVRIRGDEYGQLVYQTRTDNIVSKPIEQIVRVTVQGQDALNKAEELFGRREYTAAIDPYEQVVKTANQAWIKRYADAKLIVCYDAAGRLPDAMKVWIETLKVWPTWGLFYRPNKVPPRGSPANKEALKIIDGALEGTLGAEVALAVRKLQLAIWRVERDPRADAAEKDATERRTAPDGGKQPAEPAPEEQGPAAVGGVDVVEALGQAGRMFEAGRYDQALAEIDGAVRGLPERHRNTYLPRLLTLKAHCLLAKGDALLKDRKADRAHRTMLYGGLAAMQVVTFFPDSPAMIECLYLAGQCHEKIGRRKQAVALYRECREYGIGRAQPKWAKLATDALKRLDVAAE